MVNLAYYLTSVSVEYTEFTDQYVCVENEGPRSDVQTDTHHLEGE